MFFSCLAKLEQEMSLLYEEASKNSKDHILAPLLRFLLEDTRKHHRVFESIAHIKNERHPSAIDQCKEEMGTQFERTMNHTHLLRDELQKDTPLLNIIKGLLECEQFISEEYLTLLHSRIRLVSPEENEICKILEYIVNDEERHVEILERALNILKKT